MTAEFEPSVQVLAVTVDAQGASLAIRMGVEGHIVIANQCGSNGFEEHRRPNGATVVHVRKDGRGVGRNRNTALEHSSAELLLLADDDMVFFERYDAIARKWFDRLPHADVLVFNLGGSGPIRRSTTRPERVTRLTYFNIGAARLGFRREAILRHGLRFSELFGGGAAYAAGEDTLFLNDCIRLGLQVWAVPATLATLTCQRESSWFVGYDQQYFMDKGALYFSVSPAWWPLFAAAFAIRRRDLFRQELSPFAAYVSMCRGAIRFWRQHGRRQNRTAPKADA